MAQIFDVKLGEFGDASMAFEAGALKLAVGAQITVDQLLVIIEDAIPGQTDNKLIDGLRAILAKV